MILHLSKFYHPYFGGLEKVVQDLAESSTQDDSVTVICNSYEAKKTEVENINGVKVVKCPINFTLMSSQFSVAYFSELGKRIENSILHIHLPNPFSTFFVLFYLFLRKKCKGVVVHWHSDVVSQKVGWFFLRPFVNKLLELSDKIVVTSPPYLDSSKQLMKFKHKCEVIPIGIESIESKVNSKIVEDIRERYKGKKVIFSVGRHTYYKGFEILIEAVRSGFEDCVFLIGGVGELTASYQKLIDKYGLSEQVFLIGKLTEKDLASYFFSAEVFCFPSCERSEAYGLVQLEAMSVGTPVISANILGSGVPWVNKHLESGLIFKNGSVSELKDALLLILNDSDLRHQLSLGAKNRFENNFTIRDMNNKTAQLYLDVING
ncbi:glycosyltransferase [Agarivorans sp. Z349TD_8]|uniref:glycosyltransferase n=1 Tax=Agarivorans sp. Z349TD_8 TaxID=3421434 RepID=UPI003D7ED34D